MKKVDGRLVVQMKREIRWSVEVTLPAECPECETPVEGFNAIKEAFGLVEYGDDSEEVLSNDQFPEYGDDPLHAAKCNACGHEFYEANISTATHPEAIKAAEALAAVIDDHHAGEGAAFNRGDQS